MDKLKFYSLYFLIIFILLKIFHNPTLEIGILSIAIFYLLTKKKYLPDIITKNKLLILITIAIFIRILLIFIDQFHTLPMNQFDAQQYHNVGKTIANNFFSAEYPPWITSAYIRYGYIIGTIYLLFGSNMWLPIMLNVILSILFSINIFRITNLMFNKKHAKTAFIISLFIPSNILYSVALIRDFIVIFCISEVIYLTFLYLKKGKFRNIIYSSILMIVIYYLREKGILIIIVPFIYSILYHKIKFKKTLIIISIFLMISITYTPYFNHYLETMDTIHYFRAEGRTSYLKDTKFYPLDNFIMNIPLGVVNHLYSPLFFQIGYFTKDYIPYIESSFYLFLTLLIIINYKYFIKNIIRNKNQSIYLFFALYALIHLCIYGVIDANIGTAYRHRMQITFILVILSAPLLNRMFSK